MKLCSTRTMPDMYAFKALWIVTVKFDGAQVCGSEVSHPWLTGPNLPCDAHGAMAMASCWNHFPERLCVVTSGLHTSVFSGSCLLALTASPTVSLSVQTGKLSVVTLRCNKLHLLGTDDNWGDRQSKHHSHAYNGDGDVLSSFPAFLFFRHLCCCLIEMVERWQKMRGEKRDDMQ